MKKLLVLGLAILSCSFTASFYHSKYEGRKAADGSIFHQNKLTAASNIFKLGDSVRVTNLKNGKSVEVKITDRMAPHYRNRIDLSKRAYKQLADLNTGVIKVNVEKL